MLDLAGSARRELFEETGLDIGTMQAEAGWTLVRDSGFVALIKRVTASEDAEDLRARIVRYLAGEARRSFRRSAFCAALQMSMRTCRALRAYLAATWSDARRAPS